MKRERNKRTNLDEIKLKEELDKVKAERDELAAALKQVRTWLSIYDLWSDVLKRNMLIRKIESALAKLEIEDEN